MQFASLGSGSQGNALIVAAGSTKILVDCGFSVKNTLHRLARLGVDASEIDALLVTHEHGDHVAGVTRFASRFKVPVYATHGTQRVIEQRASGDVTFCPIDAHVPFCVGDISVVPYPVPHDAREPVQYVFDGGSSRFGVLTDVGYITPHVIEVLARCDALFLECNHDSQMLAESDYPPSLKRRIAGNFGHLENAQAGDLLREIDTSKLQHIIAAHLSEQNNRPQLAVAALASALGCAEDWIGVADQELGLDWRNIL